jgi:hypothetical protein
MYLHFQKHRDEPVGANFTYADTVHNAARHRFV